MALHRDIHWIGRQWAVTGFGMQLIDQKLKGFFDIETTRLWDEAHIETMRAKEWLNRADFDKGLEVARKRFPKDGATPSPAGLTARAVATAAPAPVLQAAPAVMPKPVVEAAPAPVAAPIEPPLQVDQPAKPIRRLGKPVEPAPAPPPGSAAPPGTSRPSLVPTPEPKAMPPLPVFTMLFAGEAKFIRPWRVRLRR